MYYFPNATWLNNYIKSVWLLHTIHTNYWYVILHTSLSLSILCQLFVVGWDFILFYCDLLGCKSVNIHSYSPSWHWVNTATSPPQGQVRQAAMLLSVKNQSDIYVFELWEEGGECEIMSCKHEKNMQTGNLFAARRQYKTPHHCLNAEQWRFCWFGWLDFNMPMRTSLIL